MDAHDSGVHAPQPLHGVSKTQEGTFPQKVKLSDHCCGWRESGLNRWMADPPSDGRDGQPRLETTNYGSLAVVSSGEAEAMAAGSDGASVEEANCDWGRITAGRLIVTTKPPSG